jgi:inhibitor of KinA sporulation pathway (predicted exonuclease)
MARQLDYVLIVDVESTCWDGQVPQGQISEIIEIGLCTVNVRSLQRGDKRSILVRPARSDVGAFCTRLTTLTPSQVAGGMPLSDALSILQHDYRSRERLFASWGDYDRNQFQRNCRDYGLEYPFGPTHLNIKNLFSVVFGLPKELGIPEACEKMGIPLEGTLHRGVDDAWNIAQLFCGLLKRTRGE